MSNSDYSKDESNISSNLSQCSDLFIDWRGTIINNQYIIIHKLGSGSYCTVWLSYDFINDKEFALKIYNREDYDHAMDEIKVFDELKQLNISNIVTYSHYIEHKENLESDDSDNSDNSDNSDDSDTECEDKFLFLFMDLCGYSMYNIIKIIGLKETDSILQIESYNNYINVCYEAINKIILILKLLHNNNYVHTDIKPENILIKKPTLECNIILEHVKNKIVMLKNKYKQNSHHLFKKNKNNNNNWINELSEIVKLFDVELLNITQEDIIKYIMNGPNEFILCDMGTTLKINDKNILKKHTTYYKAPEIILDLDYDGGYDIWSLGCSIYELLTGNILFNPFEHELVDRYDDNEDKNLLYLIVCSIGYTDIIKKSKLRHVFFTKNLKTLKGFNELAYNSIYDNLNKKNIFDNQNDKILTLIMLMYDMLKFDADSRCMKNYL